MDHCSGHEENGLKTDRNRSKQGSGPGAWGTRPQLGWKQERAREMI